MSLPKAYLSNLRQDFLSYATKRREIIKQSDDALHHAKRAIFALHRHNVAEAKNKLRAAEEWLVAVYRKYKRDSRVLQEGAYRAALEEYVEAHLFYQFVATGKLRPITLLKLDSEIFLAGLCDVPGELYRYAIQAATNGDIKLVKNCAKLAQDIVGELIEFNLTSYLRTKFDQAKQAVQKLEEVVYEVSLRK